MDYLFHGIIAILMSGILIFIYREICKYKKIKLKHDLKIYRRFNLILNDNQIIMIVKKSHIGYLPEGSYCQSDMLTEFVNLPKNRFLDKKLNKLLFCFACDLNKVAVLYSMCGRCELHGNEYKLVSYKNGSDEEHELYEKSREYSKDMFKSYKHFRDKIKQKFKI